jgi:hypothetical protein
LHGCHHRRGSVVGRILLDLLCPRGRARYGRCRQRCLELVSIGLRRTDWPLTMYIVLKDGGFVDCWEIPDRKCQLMSLNPPPLRIGNSPSGKYIQQRGFPTRAISSVNLVSSVSFNAHLPAIYHATREPAPLLTDRKGRASYNNTSFLWVVLFPPSPHGMMFPCLLSAIQQCQPVLSVGRSSEVS